MRELVIVCVRPVNIWMGSGGGWGGYCSECLGDVGWGVVNTVTWVVRW